MFVVIVPEERRMRAVAAVHLADNDGSSLNSGPLCSSPSTGIWN